MQLKTNTSLGWRSAAALAVSRVLKRSEEAAAAPQAKAATVPQPAVVEPRPDLPPLDFRTGRPVDVPLERTGTEPKPTEITRHVEKVSVLEDPARQRVRDAYVAARFTGVARTSHDLGRVRAVIRAAEIYHEDGNVRRAEELLELAASLQPSSEALPLARLEIALRLGDSEAYRRTALRFRENHPKSARWKEIVAFARTLYLTEAPFTAEAGDGFGDSAYLRPNWISHGLELAPEFMPGDLRTRVLALAYNQTHLAQREKEAA